MFFNESTETLGTIPEYFLEDVLEFQNEMKFIEDQRNVLGKDSKLQTFYSSSADLKTSVLSVTNYIYSQQYEYLKNLVVCEISLVNLDGQTYEFKQPSRYLCRIGEQIIVPLTSIAHVSKKNTDKVDVWFPGNIYRFNTRVESTITPENNFLALVYSFVDFDLKKYLMLHDLNSIFPIQDDEKPENIDDIKEESLTTY